jgi:hypothetical protein
LQGLFVLLANDEILRAANNAECSPFVLRDCTLPEMGLADVTDHFGKEVVEWRFYS